MHFFYLDETGCTGADLSNAQQPIFVLGGVSVRDEGWVATNTAVAGVLNDYFGGVVPAGFELHATDLLSPEWTCPKKVEIALAGQPKVSDGIKTLRRRGDVSIFKQGMGHRAAKSWSVHGANLLLSRAGFKKLRWTELWGLPMAGIATSLLSRLVLGSPDLSVHCRGFDAAIFSLPSAVPPAACLTSGNMRVV